MRVLAMTHLYVPHTGAGAQTTLHDLLRPLAAAGHTVDVLLTGDRGYFTEPYVLDGVNVHPYVDTGDPFRWFGTTDNRPDVVLSQLESTVRAAVLCGLHAIPHVLVLHNDMPQTCHQVKNGPTQLVVYNTEWLRASVERWLLFVADQVPPRSITLHPPIRPGDYQVSSPGDRITQVNLFTGTKGPDVFYELARRMPDRKFLGVLGAYGDQLIQDLPNVELVGPFPPDQMAAKVYSRTKVLLMPSTYESYGRAAVEACCAGIPVIGACTPGLLEALGPDGTCIDRGDVDAWETELRKLLSPRGYAAGVKRAKTVAAALDTDADLARWVAELEKVAKIRVPTS